MNLQRSIMICPVIHPFYPYFDMLAVDKLCAKHAKFKEVLLFEVSCLCIKNENTLAIKACYKKLTSLIRNPEPL
jgi:hypothetical protein